jgi:general secretion pathway protein D
MKRLCLAVVLLLLSGCAADRTYNDGMALIDQSRYEEGLAKLDEAAKLDPANLKYRQSYARQRDLIQQRYVAAAESARAGGQWEAAEVAYKGLLAIDPNNPRGRAGVEALGRDRRHAALLAEAEEARRKGDPVRARTKLREILAENSSHRGALQLFRRLEEEASRAASGGPQLAAELRRPVTLQFREASLRQIFDALSQNAGLNFLFDRDVKLDQRTTLFVRDSSIEDVLRFVLVTNQLERRVLSENTVLIYPNTQAKSRDYQELVVRNFYLTNADAKMVASLIKTLVKTKDIHIDEKLNLIVIRDTPDAVRMAERLIAAEDLAEPEVVLELEVLEVNSSLLYNLGIQYPSQINYSLIGAANTPGTIGLDEVQRRSASNVRLTVSDPFLALNLQNQVGRSNILANPRIRVRNKDKAKIHIGDKVPVITTSTTATGLVNQSVTYLDVGLKLDVEPAVSLDDEVAMKVSLEVSSIAREIQSASGTLTYQVGTRNTSTSLRLKDGETQVLAGLISDEERKTANQIPGLGDLPVLGRLFGSHKDTSSKTEIVLLITPRIVRNIARPDASVMEFPSGTENAIGAPALALQSSTAATTNLPPTVRAPTESPAAPLRAPKVLLRGPADVAPGQEFILSVSLEGTSALRSGLIDIAFDPSRFKFVRAEASGPLAAGGSSASFRANAPEGVGRMNLSFSMTPESKSDDELAKIVLRSIGAAGGSIRVEAASLNDPKGPLPSVQLPPPVTVTLKN